MNMKLKVFILLALFTAVSLVTIKAGSFTFQRLHNLIFQDDVSGSNEVQLRATGQETNLVIDLPNYNGNNNDFLMTDGNSNTNWNPVTIPRLADTDVDGSQEDGQALVWNESLSKWVPGASGDASFKVQGFTSSTVAIKGGLKRYNGKLYCTWDGDGLTENDIQTDLTWTPSGLEANKNYYVYINLNNSNNQVLTGSWRECELIDSNDFHFDTENPYNTNTNNTINLTEYAPIGMIATDGSSNITAVYDENPKDSVSWANVQAYYDKVVARYTSDAADTVAHNSFERFNVEDKDYDPYNTVTVGASWVFTAPFAGKYTVKAGGCFEASADWGEGDDMIINMVEAPSTDHGYFCYRTGVAAAVSMCCEGSRDIELPKGGQFYLEVYQASGNTRTFRTDYRKPYIEISQADRTDTQAIGTGTNVWESSRITSAPSSSTCPAGFSDHAAPVDTVNYSITIDYWDNSAGVFFKNISPTSTFLDTEPAAVEGYACIDWGAAAFDTSDYAVIRIGPGARGAYIPKPIWQSVESSGSWDFAASPADVTGASITINKTGRYSCVVYTTMDNNRSVDTSVRQITITLTNSSNTRYKQALAYGQIHSSFGGFAEYTNITTGFMDDLTAGDVVKVRGASSAGGTAVRLEHWTLICKEQL